MLHLSCPTEIQSSSFVIAGTVQSASADCGGEYVGGAVFYAPVSAPITSDAVTYTSNNSENGMVAVEYTSLLVPT